MNDIKYQCVNPGCSPSTIVSASNLRRCQIACSSDTNCRTVTFDQSNNHCELFADIPSQYGNMLPQAGVVTMIATDGRQLSAPMTTTTTTSTTSSTSTSSTSSTTSTSTTTTTSAPAVCATLCTSAQPYYGNITCGQICNTTPFGPLGSASGSVGSTGVCDTNSTFCPGGTYTIVRNTYTSVNYDCDSCCGCGSFGGCCTRIGNSSAPGIYCIKCN